VNPPRTRRRALNNLKLSPVAKRGTSNTLFSTVQFARPVLRASEPTEATDSSCLTNVVAKSWARTPPPSPVQRPRQRSLFRRQTGRDFMQELISYPVSTAHWPTPMSQVSRPLACLHLRNEMANGVSNAWWAVCKGVCLSGAQLTLDMRSPSSAPASSRTGSWCARGPHRRPGLRFLISSVDRRPL